MTVVDRISRLVELSGMSARELSLKAGLSHGAVSWMLRNPKNGVRESTIKAIASATGASAAWLLTGEGAPFASTDAVDEPSGDDAVDAHRPRSESPSTFGGFPNYAKIEKTARALAPEVPDWAWEATARTHPLWIGKDPPGAQVIADVARLIMKHRSPT